MYAHIKISHYKINTNNFCHLLLSKAGKKNWALDPGSLSSKIIHCMYKCHLSLHSTQPELGVREQRQNWLTLTAASAVANDISVSASRVPCLLSPSIHCSRLNCYLVIRYTLWYPCHLMTFPMSLFRSLLLHVPFFFFFECGSYSSYKENF